MSYFCFAGHGDPGLIRYMMCNFNVNNLKCCGKRVELGVGYLQDDPNEEEIFYVRTKAPIIFKKTCHMALLDSIKEESRRLYDNYISYSGEHTVDRM